MDIDVNMKPWLIESNVNPTLGVQPGFEWERQDKIQMLSEVFRIVEMVDFDVVSYKEKVKER